MPKSIIWSPLSEKDFISILNYLQTNWNKKVLGDFIKITEIAIGQIAENPTQFPLIDKKKQVRKCVITKHNTLFYRDRRDNIDILRIFDVRQDPHKLNF
jgi:plasmid stabilization system protein ParE